MGSVTRCEHDDYQATGGDWFDRWCNHCGALRIALEHKWLLPATANKTHPKDDLGPPPECIK